MAAEVVDVGVVESDWESEALRVAEAVMVEEAAERRAELTIDDSVSVTDSDESAVSDAVEAIAAVSGPVGSLKRGGEGGPWAGKGAD